jgi:hypothetical protein
LEAEYNDLRKDSQHNDVPEAQITKAEDLSQLIVDQSKYVDKLLSESTRVVSGIMKVDPPVDAILHSVEFIVSYGVGITPQWALIQWKGPSPANGSALSAAGQRTNVLNIALGPSNGAEQNRLIQNQTVSSPH